MDYLSIIFWWVGLASGRNILAMRNVVHAMFMA